MKTHPERSGIEFEARFFDGKDAPTLPETVHWRLDCVTTQTALVDWTALQPEQVVDEFGNVVDIVATIEVAGALNAIQNRRNASEQKALLVVADKDTDREFSKEWAYLVKRLQGRA